MMTPEERSLLTDLFNRLRSAESQPRDPDAERFIRDAAAAQPSAVYYMAQALLVQQQALAAASRRVEELEEQARASRAPQSGGFLGGMLPWGNSPWGGGASRPGEPQARAAMPAAGARGLWGTAPGVGDSPFGSSSRYGYQSPQPPQRGGGFLSGALQTAAGVAGGILAAEAISSLLSGSPGPFGEALAAESSTTIIEEVPAADHAAVESGSDYVADDFDGGDYGGGDDGGGWD